MANSPGPSRFTFDESTGALLTTGGGGGGGDVNITEILGNPVSLGNPLPVELSDGTNAFGTPSNPISVSVSGGGGAPVVVADPTNSSSTPLASLATFTGTAKATAGYATVLIGLFTDQVGVLSIEWSPDGTHWDQIQQWVYIDTGDGFAQYVVMVPIQNTFYRIAYENQGGGSQTVLRLTASLATDNRSVTLSSEAPTGNTPPPTVVQVGGFETQGGVVEPLELLDGHLIIEQGYIAGVQLVTATPGVPKVGISGSNGATLDSSTSGVLDENIKNVGNAAVVSAAAGVMKVGISGAAGTTLDGTTAGILDENVKNVGGSAVATAATGIQKVGVVGATGTALDGTTAGVLDENLKNIAGSAVVAAATGIQKVGISGAAGTTLDGTTAGILDENIKNVGGSAVSTAASGVQKVGIVGNAAGALDVAQGGTPPANALQTAAIAATALPTAASATKTVVPMGDVFGRQVVLPQAPRDIVGVQTTQIASSNAETTIVTQAASIFNDITGLQITNASALAVTVTIKDSTSGTTRKVYDLAANGGIVVHFSPPLPQASVNTNWTATLSLSTVTVDVNVDFVKNK